MKHNEKSQYDYDELENWTDRSMPNDGIAYEENRLQETVDFIFDKVKDKKKVLDFGPGIGRTFSVYDTGQYISGYDISDNYVSRVTTEAEELGLDYHHCVHPVTAGTRLPYSDDEFEIVVASLVLQHQRPDHIEQVLKELLRVSPLVVAVESKDNNALGCWAHDYCSISDSIGSDVEQKITSFYRYLTFTRKSGVQ